MHLCAAADTNHFASVNFFFFSSIGKKYERRWFSFVVLLFISDIFKVAPPVVTKYVNCGIVDLCKLKLVSYLEVSTIYYYIVGHDWKPFF